MCIIIYIYIYIYIHIRIHTYICVHAPGLGAPRAAGRGEIPASQAAAPPRIRGNHLSNTTCLTQVFFKRGE